MKKNLKNKGFTRLVDFKEATPSRTKGASLKLTTGFMMVEVIVAVSIIAVSVLAAMLVAQKSIQLSQRSISVSQAEYLIEEGAEAVRIIRDNGWNNITTLAVSTNYNLDFSGNTWVVTSDPSSIDLERFTRTVKFLNVNRDGTTGDIVEGGGTLDSGTKLVTVTVSWYENGQQVVRNLSFYIMDIFS